MSVRLAARPLARISHRAAIAQAPAALTSPQTVCSGCATEDRLQAGQRRGRRSLYLQERGIHATARREVTLLAAGLGIAAGAVVAQKTLQAYRAHQATRTAADSTQADSAAQGFDATQSVSGSSSSFFTSMRFPDGGFEEKMSRSEAARILGIRPSASEERIKEAHRRILMLNHPDRGGSKLLATKINEAKEVLLKQRS